MSDVHTFTHNAMNTTFTVKLVCEDRLLAAASASSAFNLLDELEHSLSRYIEGSDVWQINHMQTGESLFLGDATYACLRLALEMHAKTGGLFDVTLGKQIEHLKNRNGGESPRLAGSLMLDPDKPAVHCNEAGREIDLGGIGKGFSLDCMKEQLLSLGVSSGILSAGASTHLAYGETSWQIQLDGLIPPRTHALRDAAISASGSEIQGIHIVSPHRETSDASKRLWVVHAHAASADGYSTAAMLMDSNELDSLRDSVDALYYCEA